MRSGLVIGGLALAGLLYLGRKASISTALQVSPEGIRFTDVSITRLTGSVKYRLTNPGNAQVTVSNFFGIIQYRGNKLAEIAKPDAFTIPPRGSVNVSIDFRVGVLEGLSQVVSLIRSAIENKRLAGVTVDVIGGFDANGLPVPFQYPFTLIA